jgi:hypothetical protein
MVRQYEVFSDHISSAVNSTFFPQKVEATLIDLVMWDYGPRVFEYIGLFLLQPFLENVTT